MQLKHLKLKILIVWPMIIVEILDFMFFSLALLFPTKWKLRQRIPDKCALFQ